MTYRCQTFKIRKKIFVLFLQISIPIILTNIEPGTLTFIVRFLVEIYSESTKSYRTKYYQKKTIVQRLTVRERFQG